tara:strand:- start:6366 stop:6854 length:489 start_codon:yes stop_codon:yes gene_type:complete
MKDKQKSSLISLAHKWLLPEYEDTIVTKSGNRHIKLTSEPATPMGSWRALPKKLRIGTKQYDILKRIWQSGDEGMTFTDIQMYILGGEEQVQSGPSSLPHEEEPQYDYERGMFSDNTRRVRPSRGYYSTWMSYILPLFCEKGTDGKWRLTQQDLLHHFEKEG